MIEPVGRIVFGVFRLTMIPQKGLISAPLEWKGKIGTAPFWCAQKPLGALALGERRANPRGTL
jgi:hypothetical protein